MEKAKANLRVQQWVLTTAILLFAIKLVSYFLTHSVAVLTDALDSTVNVIAGIIGVYSLSLSAKPRDQNHPYGHGKAEFLSAAIEGILIILAGLVIIYQAVYNLFHKNVLEKLNYGILLSIGSAVINFVVGRIAIRQGKKNKSLALEASGYHLQTDTFSTIVVIFGLIAIALTGISEIDSLVAIIMSAIIMVVGYRIARKSIAGIMDEADEKILGRMVELLHLHPHENWIDIHNLRVIKFGSILHVDCHLTVPWYLDVHQAHREIDQLTALIRDEFGQTMEFYVHADGCMDFSCAICSKGDCPVRKHGFEKKISWNLENLISNRKHSLNEQKQHADP